MRMLIWGIVGLSGLGFAVQAIDVHGSTNERAAIKLAVRAPLADLRRRDARALCEDFTPSAAAQLTGDRAQSCERRVSAFFRSARGAGEYVQPGERTPRGRLAVGAIHWRADRATAISSADAGGERRRPLQLEMIAQRWRIATPATLALFTDCHAHPFGTPGCVSAMSLRFAAR
jgi:hypothetical protein